MRSLLVTLRKIASELVPCRRAAGNKAILAQEVQQQHSIEHFSDGCSMSPMWWCLWMCLCVCTGTTTPSRPTFTVAVFLPSSSTDWRVAMEVIKEQVNEVHGGLLLGEPMNLELMPVDVQALAAWGLDFGTLYYYVTAGIWDLGTGVAVDTVCAVHAEAAMPYSVHGWMDFMSVQTFLTKNVANLYETNYYGTVLTLDGLASARLSGVPSLERAGTWLVVDSLWTRYHLGDYASAFGYEMTYVGPSVEWCEKFAFMTDTCLIMNVSGHISCECGQGLLTFPMYEIAEPKLGSATPGFEEAYCNESMGLDSSLCGTHASLDNETGLGLQNTHLLNPGAIRFAMKILEDAYSRFHQIDVIIDFAYAAAEVIAALHMLSTYKVAQNLPWFQPSFVIIDHESFVNFQDFVQLPNGSRTLDTGKSDVQLDSTNYLFTGTHSFDPHGGDDPVFQSGAHLTAALRDAGVVGDVMPYLRLASVISMMENAGRKFIPDGYSLTDTYNKRILLRTAMRETAQGTTMFGNYNVTEGAVQGIDSDRNLEV
eukprot:6457543-Amphidinium_carterae.1